MRLSRIAFALLLAVVAIAVAFVAVNRFDEDLRPEVAQFYASGTMSPLRAESGYAFLAGFAAPADQDPRRQGLEWVRSAAEAARANRPDPKRKDALRIRGSDELLCFPQDFDCVARFGRNPRSVTEMALDNALLLQRYAKLQAQADLADAGIETGYGFSGVDYSAVLGTQALFLSQVAAQAAAGDASGALERLAADAAFNRRWLAQGRTLLSKMVAVRALSRDFRVATQIARRVPSTAIAEWQALRRVARPLEAAELALGGPVIRFESAALKDHVLGARVVDRYRLRGEFGFSPIRADLAKYFLLPNATLNLAYQDFVLWEKLDKVATKDIEARTAAAKEQSKRVQAPDWTWFYNPGGKSVVGYAAFDYGSYVLRVRDLDALARLACAAVSIREHQVPAGAVVEHLARAVPECGDPYTGQPMAWDAAKGKLWFAARSPGTAERFGGSAGRVEIAPF